MSTADLIGHTARVDRWSSLREFWQERKVPTSRLGWLRASAVAMLLAVPAAWTLQDPVQRQATLGAISVSERPPAAFPLEVNPRVERWIEAFETTRRPEFETLMRRRALYSEMIRAKLRERGMPGDLLYIPVIESGLSPFAVSRVFAVGLWQFMSPTALQYGLRVDEYVDERRDPVQATDAALDYLAWLHDRFGGSWYLAAAAFNAGPGRVERIVNLHAEGRMGDDQVFWEILEYLPRETREYVPKMIAVTKLAGEAGVRAFYDADVQPYRYENVFVPGSTPLTRVARAIGVELVVLRDLNPHLIRGVTPPNEMYGVRVPPGHGAAAVAGLSIELGVSEADD